MSVFPALSEAQVRDVFLRDVVEDILVVETFQQQIHLSLFHAKDGGEISLVDKCPRAEQSWIFAQHGLYQEVFFLTVVAQAIEVVAFEGEHHPRGIVVVFCISHISRLHEDFNC